MMKRTTLLLLALALPFHITPVLANKPPAREVSDSTSASKKLKNIKKQLIAEQQKLKEKNEQQKRAQELLRQTQLAIAAARRELDELNRQQRLSWTKLQDLQNKLNQLQTEVGNTKAQIARLLTSNYQNKQPHSVVIFLKNADANQKARFLEYSRHINAANDSVMKKLAQQQEQLEQQESQIHRELERLKQLAAVQQNKLRQLGQSHKAALADSQKLNGEISSHNQKITQLRESEKQLSQIITQIIAKQQAQLKAQAAEKQQLAKQRTQTTKPNQTQPAPTNTANNMELNQKFSRLQGTMRRPVSGSIAGRFGQPRNGGGTWRGVFIATAPAGVQAIAAGEVVYASELGGFGKTVMIDHDDGYLSIYTGLQQMSVSVGERLLARQILGMSGTLPTGEQGLYFEIRYRNRPMNPLSWVR